MPIPTPILTGHAQNFDIDMAIRERQDEKPHAGERQLMSWFLPSWQRPNVWTMEQKTRFIESLFLGLYYGVYITTEWDWTDGKESAIRKPRSGWVIDGQQRLSALNAFVTDQITVFEDVNYSTMTTAERRRFQHLPFPMIKIARLEEDVLKELYERLTFGGIAHTEADRELLLAK